MLYEFYNTLLAVFRFEDQLHVMANPFVLVPAIFMIGALVGWALEERAYLALGYLGSFAAMATGSWVGLATGMWSTSWFTPGVLCVLLAVPVMVYCFVSQLISARPSMQIGIVAFWPLIVAFPLAADTKRAVISIAPAATQCVAWLAVALTSILLLQIIARDVLQPKKQRLPVGIL